MKQLHNSKLIDINILPHGSCHIIHSFDSTNALNYWGKHLNLEKLKFKIINDHYNNSKFGVCHVYLSDVLLRRVVDELNEYIINIKLINNK